MDKARVFMKTNTIDYYNNNASVLLKEYDDADMSDIHHCIEKYLKSNSKVLDIGFGSGRDIRYFNANNVEIYGIDASRKFVEIFKNLYPKMSTYVSFSVLPEINIPNISDKYFDLIFTMATWMHLPQSDHKKAIVNIKNNLKDNGIFILGYSYNKRDNDPRFFEDLNPEETALLFSQNGFYLLDEYFTKDSLNRENLKWIIQVFKLKESVK